IEEVDREIGERVKIGKLNVFEAPDIAEKYGIPATPALIIFKNGEPVERAVGVRPKQALIDKLNSL
ncbi:MAG: thioredoxin domain-containing protein, partial [Candidatus Pacebacteria bacterium]|nr:thioredoxin domain-containing protein [Candidatus Paceibacterota bacterium]